MPRKDKVAADAERKARGAAAFAARLRGALAMFSQKNWPSLLDLVKPGRRLTWVMFSDDPVKTAGYLVEQAGGPDAAHAAIDRWVDENKKGHRLPMDDAHLLDIAACIQREDKCGDVTALRRVAELRGWPEDDERHNINFVSSEMKRLKRKLKLNKMTTLREWEQHRHRVQTIRESDGSFSFRIKDPD